MAASEEKKTPTEDDKKNALKGLIKEALGEFAEERKESGRTDSGKESAPKSNSLWDSLFS